MRIISGTAPRALRLAGRGRELSAQARRWLKWMDYYESHGHNARLTCRYFGVSPQTFYRWRRRYDPHNLGTLEDRSRRPAGVVSRPGAPTWSAELAQAVFRLREGFPRWGKDKLVVLLRREGWSVSTSMVGRILRRLREQGVLIDPPRQPVSARKRPWLRPYAVRKPREYSVASPGDLVQVDTLDLRPLPGVVLKQFTARDVVSRWDVLMVTSQATAPAARRFLDTLEERTPFPVRAIQVDGGPEFQAVFEEACQQRGIHLFVLPPRSPKLNGHVERANRTHAEEFYQVSDLPWTVAELNHHARAWERVYNTVRPHQALGYKTPMQFLEEFPDRSGRPP